MSDVKFEIVRFALSTAAAGNTQDVTISGFGTPKAAIFILSSAVTDDTISNDGSVGIGFVAGTSNSVVSAGSQHNLGTTNTNRIMSNSGCILLSGETGKFSFNSWITDGIRLDIDTAFASAFQCTCILIGGTDVSNALVGYKDDLGTGTSAVDINTVGFEPDLVFVGSICHTSVTSTTHNILSFGVGHNDGLDTQRVTMTSSADGDSTSTKANAYIGNDSITGQIFNDSLTWDGVIGSYDASGFSITPNSSAGSDIINYLCLKFTNDPNIKLIDVTWPTSGDYAETGLGFTPNFGLISSVYGVSARNTSTTSGVFGAAISVFDENAIYTTCYTDEDAVATAVAKGLSSDQLRILADDGATDAVIASSYAFNQHGWDFTLSTNPASDVLGWGLAVGTAAPGEIAAFTEALTITTYPALININDGAVSATTQGLTLTTYPASIDLSGIEGSTVALTLTTYPATVLPVQVVSGTGNQIMGLSLGLGLGL